ncbi:MAG: aminoglycoside phosphotransferase family protein [Planctomycetes bacterium]|nr:aminoglycoside phosphotransferase family protein [Planctomycetota bacterium]
MDALKTQEVERYLRSLWGPRVRIFRCVPIGKAAAGTDAKGFGYGVPLRIDADVDGRARSVVLETMTPNSFGHEHRADRAQALLWSHGAYNELPRHVRSIDVGATRNSGELVSLGDADEFFVLRDYEDGETYSTDLARLRDAGAADDLDFARADALCDYLVGIHRVRGTDPGLYVRRIRELVGHGECIMGILDSYPAGSVPASRLRDIERRCVDWRWALKPRTHRLRQVHGDFHPWNILFRKGTDFTVLDRSRGEWGDPADDVTSLTLNYAFFSLQRSGRVDGDFERMFRRFWDRYLEGSGDGELLEVAAPFLTFRSLVMANPIWYPRLDETIRARLLAFALHVLETPRFDPARINSCFEVPT